MAELSERWQQLGGQLAQWADEVAPVGTLARARARLVAPAPAPRGRPRPLRAWALAVVAVSVLALVLWSARQGAALSFAVGAPPAPGRVGDWVAAGSAPLGVRFTDGSRVEVSRGARMRVTATTAHGAVVLIERGTVRAAINHRGADTDWRLRAGPFTVRVTGTELSASWDPEAEVFDLLMHRGSVEVHGPWLPPGRRVVAGERLRVVVREGRMRLSTLAEADLAGSASGAPARPAAPEASLVAPGGSARPTAAPAAHASASSGWRARAARHDYRGAMAVLDASAFEALVGQSGAAGLSGLADAARFGGRPDRARRALVASRRRFGASGATTFLLGKIAADQLRSPGEAIQWFETYLKERPRGPLAEQALGRVLELKQRGASGPAAARRYLARYPRGAYAPLAKRVLERSSR